MQTPTVIAALVGACAALALAGCGDDGSAPEPTAALTTMTGPTTTELDTASEHEAADPHSAPRAAKVKKRPDLFRLARRQAARAYRAYIDAIGAADGAAICELIAPGFERVLKPPVRRSGCAGTISASIGFKDPRGFPVWQGTVLSGIDQVDADAERQTARVTALIVTNFRDRREPSIESDIAYLELVAGHWRLAKASGALYRAVGKPDVPPSVIAPPDNRRGAPAGISAGR